MRSQFPLFRHAVRRRGPCRRGFTLVELLVVVAIIMVLLAMLMPTMRRARYTAVLTACAANMHQIGIGATTYSSDFFGMYPYRSVDLDSGSPKRSKLQYNPVGKNIWDDRPKLRSYVPIPRFICPGLGQPESLGRRLDASIARDVNCNYEIYFGTRILRREPASAMMRTIDRPLYNGDRFRVLLADIDWDWLGTKRNYNHVFYSGSALFLPADTDDTFNYAWGTRYGTTDERGPIDRNFLFKDLSVTTYTHLAMNDARLRRVPFSSKTVGMEYSYIPSN